MFALITLTCNLVTEDLTMKVTRLLQRDPALDERRANEWWHDLTGVEIPSLCQGRWDSTRPKMGWGNKRLCGAEANPEVAKAAYGELLPHTRVEICYSRAVY